MNDTVKKAIEALGGIEKARAQITSFRVTSTIPKSGWEPPYSVDGGIRALCDLALAALDGAVAKPEQPAAEKPAAVGCAPVGWLGRGNAPAPASDRDWIEDAGCENGSYTCRCSACGNWFIGHKRRLVCKVCSGKPAAAPASAEERIAEWARKAIADFDQRHEAVVILDRVEISDAVAIMRDLAARAEKAEAEVERLRVDNEKLLRNLAESEAALVGMERERDAAEAERDRLRDQRDRCRKIAQRIIAEIGSAGPENAEEGVDRLLAKLAEAEAALAMEQHRHGVVIDDYQRQLRIVEKERGDIADLRAKLAEAEKQRDDERALREREAALAAADEAAYRARIKALEHQTRCPECGCATPEDAEAAECGCDAPVCAIPSSSTLAQEFVKLRAERDEAVASLRQMHNVLDASGCSERDPKLPLVDRVESIIGGLKNMAQVAMAQRDAAVAEVEALRRQKKLDDDIGEAQRSSDRDLRTRLAEAEKQRDSNAVAAKMLERWRERRARCLEGVAPTLAEIQSEMTPWTHEVVAQKSAPAGSAMRRAIDAGKHIIGLLWKHSESLRERFDAEMEKANAERDAAVAAKNERDGLLASASEAISQCLPHEDLNDLSPVFEMECKNSHFERLRDVRDSIDAALRAESPAPRPAVPAFEGDPKDCAFKAREGDEALRSHLEALQQQDDIWITTHATRLAVIALLERALAHPADGGGS